MFTVRPSAARVGLNGIAKFDCVAQGNPPPSVFWAKEVRTVETNIHLNNFAMAFFRDSRNLTDRRHLLTVAGGPLVGPLEDLPSSTSVAEALK